MDRDRLLAIIETQNEIAASDLDLDVVMSVVADRARRLTGASASVVELADGDELVYTAASGDATAYVGTRLRSASSLSGLAVRTGTVLASSDTDADDRVDRAACRRVGARSMVCVPLRHRGEAIGVLKVYSGRPDAFDAEDTLALERLAGVIGAHMAHAQSFAAEAHLSRHDGLTGLGNRRAYDERLAIESARVRRYEQPLALCLLDLDGFKAVNDELGHPVGDEILRRVARVLAESRGADEAFRIGGDEFAVIMPHTNLEGAWLAASRLAFRIADETSREAAVTAGFGVATSDGDAIALHAAADRSLLARKARRSRRFAAES